MNLSSVSYLNGKLYIGLCLIPLEYNRLKTLENVAIQFSIRALGNEVDELILVKENHIFLIKYVLFLQVPLKQLHKIEQTSIYIDALGFKCGGHKRSFMLIHRLFRLSHIFRDEFNVSKIFLISEHIKQSSPPLPKEPLEPNFRCVPVAPHNFIRFEKTPDPAQSNIPVEKKSEKHGEIHNEIIENDINRLLFDCYLSCLSNLPRPFGDEGIRLGKALMESLKGNLEGGIA